MLITYHANTNQLSPSSRIVIDHDATLDPATTIMFCKINEQKLRTMIFRNDGTIIKTPQTPKTLIKKLLAPHGDLGAVLIDGIINHVYQTSHPGTRQLPIMGKDCLIFPAVGMTRHPGCWVFLNKYPIRKESPYRFTVDIPEHDIELRLEVDRKVFQANKNTAYQCYGVAQAIFPQRFTVKLPPHYETTLTNQEVANIMSSLGTSRIVKILKDRFGMSLWDIKRIIK